VTVYVDSSVLLRFVFGERRQLREWPAITRAVSSTLVRLECLRVIDRARLRSRLPDAVVADMHETAQRHLAGFDLVPLDAAILDRAAEPFSTLVASLDAIHLATALLLRQDIPGLSLATHDRELATAARASGFDVLGV
jgi:hypothetical protein